MVLPWVQVYQVPWYRTAWLALVGSSMGSSRAVIATAGVSVPLVALLAARLVSDAPIETCTDASSHPDLGPYSHCGLLKSLCSDHAVVRHACACTCGATRTNETGGVWWYRGEAYALGAFVGRHPGGARYLLNAVDTDITALFESHHLNDTRARALLAEYRLTTPPPPPTVKFRGALYGRRTRVHNSTRYAALKAEVAAAFDPSELKDPTAAYRAVQLAVLAAHAAVLVLCLRARPWARGLAAHAALGVTSTWCMALGHNGMHCWTRRPLEAALLTFWFDSPFRWMLLHLQSHHMHTNTTFDAELSLRACSTACGMTARMPRGRPPSYSSTRRRWWGRCSSRSRTRWAPRRR